MKTTDKIAEKLVSLMIQKIETISSNWKKPWFSPGMNIQNFIPRNLSGRSYSGGNIFMLLFLCEEMGYKTPVFLTFKQAKEQNITILKGQSSFPVYFISFCAYDKSINKRISIEDYNGLSEAAKESYRVFANTKYYPVFNLDQTNFSEIYPDKWGSLVKEFTPKTEITSTDVGMYANQILDGMLMAQSWECPISLKQIDRACYAPFSDSITMPEKRFFVNGEAFYATLLHEMAHSTGVAHRLNRPNFLSRDNEDYGREELVAELTAALTSLFFGISAGIREENAQYLKGWIADIKKDPKFLLSVFADSMRAVRFIAEKLNVNIDQAAEQVELKEAI